MNKKIKLKPKSVYGNNLIYPACHTSELLAKLLERKTLRKKDLEILKELGYEISLLPGDI